MNSFFDLSNSTDETSHVSFTIIMDLLAKIFGVSHITKGQTYYYTTKLETDTNWQLILTDWKLLFFGQKQSKQHQKNKRLVFWVINKIKDLFNQTYLPQIPITLTRFAKSQRSDNGSHGTVTRYELIMA